MAIRIKPPHSSVRRLNRFPQNTPIRLPAIERTKEVKPIIAIGERMDMNEFMPTKAKEMPTATHRYWWLQPVSILLLSG